MFGEQEIELRRLETSTQQVTLCTYWRCFIKLCRQKELMIFKYQFEYPANLSEYYSARLKKKVIVGHETGGPGFNPHTD